MRVGVEVVALLEVVREDVRVERLGDVEEAHSGEDGDHEVLVREVGIERAAERELERRVVRCVVAHGRVREPREELIDVADALHRAERVAVPAREVRFTSI